MDEHEIMKYFLGANTCHGFYSLYDSFVSLDDGDFLWVIKGGAGCGKSSFMKMLGAAAERAGLQVEYAQCSGDPDSLDGVYIPELRTAYMDGTAPHVADTRMTASDSTYLDLGAFYDCKAISEYRPELEILRRGCSEMYSKAYAALKAAGALRSGWQSTFYGDDALDAARNRVKGIAAREFGKRQRESGTETKRFLSAITCKGCVSYTESAANLCRRVYILDNRFLLGEAVLPQLAQAAMSAGYDIYTCPNPLAPEVLEAVYIPALSLGFCCSDSGLAETENTRRIRLDSFVASERRSELRRCRKLIAALIDEAINALHDAKLLHDKIETIYNPNVDFDGVYNLVRKHIESFGLK